VVRTDDGEGVRKFSQWHRIHGKGVVWALGLPEKLQKQVHLYRISDEVIRSAIANHDPTLIVEGEGKVDLLLSMGIAATCAIGAGTNVAIESADLVLVKNDLLDVAYALKLATAAAKLSLKGLTVAWQFVVDSLTLPLSCRIHIILRAGEW